ncbi:MAG: hypothetical protein GF384_04430, partial [Elusimicrobia bacterium]|nr:hypothetical protein [Elusimicrobiota bacterium]
MIKYKFKLYNCIFTLACFITAYIKPVQVLGASIAYLSPPIMQSVFEPEAIKEFKNDFPEEFDREKMLCELGFLMHAIMNQICVFDYFHEIAKEHNCGTQKFDALVTLVNDAHRCAGKCILVNTEGYVLEEYLLSLKKITQKIQKEFDFNRIKDVFVKIDERLKDQGLVTKEHFTPEFHMSSLLYIKNMLTDIFPTLTQTPQRINLKALITSVYACSDIELKNIKVNYEAGDIEFETDETALYRALLNVINSIDYDELPDDAILHIATNVSDDNASIIIQIADPGMGIEPEQVRHILEDKKVSRPSIYSEKM